MYLAAVVLHQQWLHNLHVHVHVGNGCYTVIRNVLSKNEKRHTVCVHVNETLMAPLEVEQGCLMLENMCNWLLLSTAILKYVCCLMFQVKPQINQVNLASCCVMPKVTTCNSCCILSMTWPEQEVTFKCTLKRFFKSRLQPARFSTF